MPMSVPGIATSTVPKSVSTIERPEAMWTIAPEIMPPAIAPSRAPTIPAQKRSGTNTVKCHRAIATVNQTTAAISARTPGRDFVAADACTAMDGRNGFSSSMSPVLAAPALLALAPLLTLLPRRLGAVALGRRRLRSGLRPIPSVNLGGGALGRRLFDGDRTGLGLLGR